MKSLLVAVALVASTSAFAAPAFFTPMGKVINTTGNSYELRDSSFGGSSQYYAQIPSFIPMGTLAPYGISVPNGSISPAPSVGDVNTVTYQAGGASAMGCTFQFVYQGNGKFAITSLTDGCKVQNGTDLVLQ